MPKSQPITVLSSDEEFPMTMQVAMVGTDGIVLASDTQWMNNERDVRHTSTASKIKIHYEKGVAIACARSLALASRVADDLLDELSDVDWSLLEMRAIPIAEKVLDAATNNRSDFQCLIVTSRPTLAAFHLCSGVYPQQKHPTCQRIPNCQVAGDTVNPAVFWSERYYWRSSLRHEIQQLVALAAQVICSAHELSKDAISGLEIVVCDGSGPHRVSEDSIQQFQSDVKQWDQQIEGFFAGYAHDFAFIKAG